MHLDNVFYGHRRILARYCQVSERPIWGHLQHGWGPTTGYSHFPMRLVPWMPKLVWSQDNAVAAIAAGMRNVTAIGAPWGYLLELEGRPPPPDAAATLFFPAHGWERNRIAADHAALIEVIREREDRPVTVCLYWHDYEVPEKRARFEDAGFRVVCNGSRDDPAFLHRFLAELANHDRVASNRVSTPIWYSGLAGRSVEVYGPTFHFDDPSEGDRWRAYEKERWPELLDGGLSAHEARMMAAREIGGDQLLDPDRLAAVLGWEPPAPRARRIVRVGALTDHHVRRIVVNLGKLARLSGWR